MAFPSNTIVADICIQTPWAVRRLRNYYVPETPPPGITQLEAVANAIQAFHASSFKGVSTTQVQFLRTECRYYGGGSSEFEANSTTAAVAGDLPSGTPGVESESEGIADTLPDEAALIIQIRTGNVGRHMRGRRFLCGLSEQVQNAGVIQPAWYTTAKAIADKFPMDITVSGTFSTVLHSRHYARKTNSLHPITKAYALRALGSRIDRRRPLRLERL